MVVVTVAVVLVRTRRIVPQIAPVASVVVVTVAVVPARTRQIAWQTVALDLVMVAVQTRNVVAGVVRVGYA